MNLFYFFLLLGAVIMFANIIAANSLKKKVPGGFVGRWLSLMLVFMFFFFLAEAGSFFFIAMIKYLPLSYFLISLVLFFGSVYVGVTVRFIYHLLKELEVHK
jgi:hypothetical protein